MLTDDEIREICDRYELIYNITDNVVFYSLSMWTLEHIFARR